MTTWIMEVGQELPSRTLDWLDSSGTPVDFSSGWTFTVKISKQSTPTVTLVEKTSGITGAATSPNVTIDFTASELSTVAPGKYVVRVIARRTADSKDRVFNPGSPIELVMTATST